MKTIYTIETKYYDNYSIDAYTNRKEWEEAINAEACTGVQAGKGEKFHVAIYELPNNTPTNMESWEGTVYHSAARDRYAHVDSTPENWGEPTEMEDINYYSIDLIEDPGNENDGKYTDDSGEMYDTEEEAIANNNPTQYMAI